MKRGQCLKKTSSPKAKKLSVVLRAAAKKKHPKAVFAEESRESSTRPDSETKRRGRQAARSHFATMTGSVMRAAENSGKKESG